MYKRQLIVSKDKMMDMFDAEKIKAAGITELEIRSVIDVYKRQELLTKNHDKLISRTVTVDDIFASVNYLLGLDHGIGVTDEIDHLRCV